MGSTFEGAMVEPYVMFGGRCEEALAFYERALGATIESKMKFGESPDPMPPGVLAPGFEHKVMHSSFRVGGSVVMASDGCGPGAGFHGFSLSLAVRTLEEADRAFAALSEGGKVTMPIGKTFFSPRFGMVIDRFGVSWMVIVPREWGTH